MICSQIFWIFSGGHCYVEVVKAMATLKALLYAKKKTESAAVLALKK
jgi:hypothetical protein